MVSVASNGSAVLWTTILLVVFLVFVAGLFSILQLFSDDSEEE